MVAVPRDPATQGAVAPTAAGSWRAAQGDGPSILVGVLTLVILGGTTYLGAVGVLDAQAVGLIYLGTLRELYAVAKRRDVRNGAEGEG